MSFLSRLLIPAIALLIGAAIWLPLAHLFFAPSADLLPGGKKAGQRASALASGIHGHWFDETDGTVDQMREVNPEWDFMGRTFYSLGLANLALREPDRKAEHLTRIDRLLEDTLRLEAENGHGYYLMSYHQVGSWKQNPVRSMFVDGEIGLVMGARLLVEDDPEVKALFRERVSHIRARMESGPILHAESYPDECWLFCNAIGAATLTISDVVDGTNHRPFVDQWLAETREHLVDERTGLLISAYHFDGRPHPAGNRPEGTTIWVVSHFLQILDPEFAKSQYELAREVLGMSMLGVSYSREWPADEGYPMDVDSGVVIPVAGASASASGLYLVGAAAFEDEETLRELWTGLEFAGFRKETNEEMSFRTAGGIGNAVIFYSLALGPLWDEFHRRAETKTPNQP